MQIEPGNQQGVAPTCWRRESIQGKVIILRLYSYNDIDKRLSITGHNKSQAARHCRPRAEFRQFQSATAEGTAGRAQLIRGDLSKREVSE